MFYYDLFGSKGTKLDGVSSYFDNNIDYDGDGKYSIDFDNYSQEVSLKFDIIK